MTQVSNHTSNLKTFRMICNRSGSVHLFTAYNVQDARNQARTFFEGPVNNGGIVVTD